MHNKQDLVRVDLALIGATSITLQFVFSLFELTLHEGL